MEEPLDKDPEEAQDTHSQEDIAYRLSLLPCVREALTELPYEPLKNEKGNWEVQARTPRRRDHQSNRIEVIKIVIAYDPRKGWHLKTYHPYWDTTSKKKPVRSRP